MSLIKWEPLNIDDFFQFPEIPQISMDLAVDLFEEKGNVIAIMNVAGIDPKNINIEIEKDFLRISGSRNEEKEQKNKNYYSKQISRGSFQRIIPLHFEIKEDKVSAEIKDGVLKVIMPQKKLEANKKKKIDVKVKGSAKKVSSKKKVKAKAKQKKSKKK